MLGLRRDGDLFWGSTGIVSAGGSKDEEAETQRQTDEAVMRRDNKRVVLRLV